LNKSAPSTGLPSLSRRQRLDRRSLWQCKDIELRRQARSRAVLFVNLSSEGIELNSQSLSLRPKLHILLLQVPPHDHYVFATQSLKSRYIALWGQQTIMNFSFQFRGPELGSCRAFERALRCDWVTHRGCTITHGSILSQNTNEKTFNRVPCPPLHDRCITAKHSPYTQDLLCSKALPAVQSLYPARKHHPQEHDDRHDSE
jgi:hypothetical protein